MSKIKTKPLNDAKSIFVANVKGGVGKSTLSIMLARELAERARDNASSDLDFSKAKAELAEITARLQTLRKMRKK